MVFENIIKEATLESENGTRKGDKKEEIIAIQEYIKNAQNIVVPNKNGIKVEALNTILTEYGVKKAKILKINTNFADYTRFPTLSKALCALDQTNADLIIARGRLGIPGSGSILLFIDNKGRILTAGMSPSHIIHQKTLTQAVKDETKDALEKIGLKKRVKEL